MVTQLSGLLVVDKPQGPTSHDVVGRMRKALSTRAIGHAGTLDPMASGVLLIMVGSCTKLSQFLSLEQKSYDATVRFGESTDTLDALGSVTECSPVPTFLREQLYALEHGLAIDPSIAQALTTERSRTVQAPPVYSAIKTGGLASYARARRGETVSLPERPVRVHALEISGASAERTEVSLRMTVSKGYYVRSLARDLGQALGTPSHLVGLRRTSTGPYVLDDAVSPTDSLDLLMSRLMPVEEVAKAFLACATLTQQGVRRALYGQRLGDEDFVALPGEVPSAWFGPDGRLVAIGDRSRGYLAVLRAFSQDD